MHVQFAHVQAVSQAHFGPQAQAGVAACFWQPHLQSGPLQGLQAQGFRVASFMRVSIGSVVITRRQCMEALSSELERNGYSGRTLTGEIPNIRLKVREKWAESANPPAYAASVSVLPAT